MDTLITRWVQQWLDLRALGKEREASMMQSLLEDNGVNTYNILIAQQQSLQGRSETGSKSFLGNTI